MKVVVHVGTERCTQSKVDALRQAVRLRMVWGAHSHTGTSQAEKFLPETTCETRITVRHKAGWPAIQTKNVVKIDASHLGGSDFGLANANRDSMGHATEMAGENENAIVAAFRNWQISHEIQADSLPITRGHRQRTQQSIRGRVEGLAIWQIWQLCT